MSQHVETKATPAQQGVQYIGGATLTFSGGNFVPAGDTASEKESAVVEEGLDDESDTSNVGTANHHLVMSGDFKVKDGATIPHVGDAIQDNFSPTPRWWVITSDVEVTGFSKGGKPVMVKMELKHFPKVSAALDTP